ncbi:MULTISPECIES: efflux RND transporter permease subunit [Hydrocarboniphaga]|uniref:efflux RND transporter permease subunit n=1 Tax=Hydrocarboniphaga TaxID=243627 RepID=UPI002ABA44E9|nr:efflux RND transporter permease subunit [Hydrocarboniphaga sp.]MDZ4076782.1 efflux RND transporter permease subunit [Hydrocarboniphaga sp.]
MRFNLSEWALANRPLVIFFMVLLAVMGVRAYTSLGQSEDPPFTFRVMVIQTYWPGASADEMDRLVTDRIEEKLLELETLDFVRSYSRPGESVVTIIIRDDLPPSAMQESFYQIRKKIGDIRGRLPAGIVGPLFNDEFGDTFGNIYALTGPEFSYEELKDYGDRIRDRLLRVPQVAKVDFLGTQEERVFVDLANAKRGQLGIPLTSVVNALQSQNAIVATGSFDTPLERIYTRVSGRLQSVDDLRNLPIAADGRSVRLGDIADIYRGYQDPPATRMRVNGVSALGISVSMEKGGHIIRLGQSLDAEIEDIRAGLPLGMELSRVADQPRAVTRGIDEFAHALIEAVAIVLAVSFISLGVRTGLVVALTIPLVLAATFVAMRQFGIDLHKISLGSLVLALGLLVDDAIIAVEMMAVKLEQGYDRLKAAAFAYTSTAFPMLTGTLITAAGFLPIATAASSTGEYTRSIFQVVTIALLLSWIAAVVFVPLLGYYLLPEHAFRKSEDEQHHDIYDTRMYRAFRKAVQTCVDARWTTIVATLGIFVGAIVLFGMVPQQFFPSSTRLELLVDLKLPEGASLDATDEAAKRLEALLKKQEGIENFVAYVGSGTPRFYLALDQQLPAASFTQFVINTHDIKAREALRAKLLEALPLAFPDLRWRVNRLENGPPVGYVLQFRVMGPDRAVAQQIAEKVAAIFRANPYPAGIHLDSYEPSKVIKVKVDQDRARALGVTSSDIAQTISGSLDGAQLSDFREENKLIPITLRGPVAEQKHLNLLGSLSIPTAGGSVPLAQLAQIEQSFEPGILWRRDRIPTVTVRADIYANVQPPVVVSQLLPEIQKIELPRGYHIETGGTVEDSGKGSASVNAGMPLFLLCVLTLLMIQLKSFSRTVLVFLTAPLGIIGVAVALLLLLKPFGFVAMLGTIALAGMIMRNTVILVDQIEQDITDGHPPQVAIVDATVRRLRPIVLTAAAAVLAMIPLSRSEFFGPMAVAIMGGLIAATLLTLLFVPALYAAWFRVPRTGTR